MQSAFNLDSKWSAAEIIFLRPTNEQSDSKSVALTINLRVFEISIVAKLSLRSYGVSYVLRSLFCVSSWITEMNCTVQESNLQPSD